MKYSLPKGTFDILPSSDEALKESHRWAYLESVLKTMALEYGYSEIRTPIFEKTELFTRSAGETSDIVSKEMYTFEDKAKRSMSLRPEGTAPIMRAYVDKHLYHGTLVSKFFYTGPYFRYDRPQAGRYRQFHQFGIEAIGDHSPQRDFEIIELAVNLLKQLGITNTTVLINSVGSVENREPFIKALKEYLAPHTPLLSKESLERLEKNPLRILDTKDPQEIELLKNIPSMIDSLDTDEKHHFDRVCALLEEHGISYKIDDRLVRGLDYYTKTVFEITSDALGAQNTIIAGGRFDNLIHSLGGPKTPACGFALGMERLLHTMISQDAPFPEKPAPTAIFLPLDEASKSIAMKLVSLLRGAHIPSDFLLGVKNIAKGLKQAGEMGATYAAIIGEEECAGKHVQLKNLFDRSQCQVAWDDLVSHFKDL